MNLNQLAGAERSLNRIVKLANDEPLMHQWAASMLVILTQRSVADLQKKANPVVMDGTLTKAEADLLRQNQHEKKITVIKSYRERTGLGLVVSKCAVEQWLVEHGYGYWDIKPNAEGYGGSYRAYR